ncbi:MAG: HipA N-terminal domain-containing protein [Elusimicrobia bacterium]|nr:HipA N-terminal domain-containing protein [Elusimicrobiota bacterium]
MDQPRRASGLDRAAVFYGPKRAGVLVSKGDGFEFAYDSAYLADHEALPISLSIPLRADKYESKALFPFFDGLLPEGWLLEVICATAKIDPADKFRLLLHTGEDPVGAVSVRPFEEADDG